MTTPSLGPIRTRLEGKIEGTRKHIESLVDAPTADSSFDRDALRNGLEILHLRLSSLEGENSGCPSSTPEFFALQIDWLSQQAALAETSDPSLHLRLKGLERSCRTALDLRFLEQLHSATANLA